MVTQVITPNESSTSEGLGRFTAPFFLPGENLSAKVEEAGSSLLIPNIIREIWNKSGYVTPKDLFGLAARTYLDELSIDKSREYISTCVKMADSIGFFDPMTGFEKPVTKELNLEFLKQYRADKPNNGKAFYITGDISNLRGLNYALSGLDIKASKQFAITQEGEKAANAFISILAKEFALAFKEVAPDAVCEFYRDGGDELSVIAHGITEEQVKQAISQAGKNINAVSKEAGLENLTHAKYPDEPNRKGVSFGAEYTEIDENFDLGVAQMQLEQNISAAKASAISQGESVPQLNADQIKGAVAVLEKRLLEIEKKFHPYTGIIPPWRTEMEKEFPFSDIPIEEIWDKSFKGHAGADKVNEIYLTGSTRRMLQARHALDRCNNKSAAVYSEHEGSAEEGAEHYKIREKFFSRLYHIYERSEAVTGLKSERFYDDLVEVIKHCHEHRKSYAIVYTDIQNIAGVNKERGTTESNAHIGEVGNIVWTAVCSKEGCRPYRNNGASAQRIYSIVPTTDESTTPLLSATIHDDVFTHAKKNSLTDVEHPRRPGAKEYKGFRVIMAEGEVSPDVLTPYIDKAKKVVYSTASNVTVEKEREVVSLASKFAANDLLKEMDAKIEKNDANRLAWDDKGLTITFNQEDAHAQLEKEIKARGNEAAI